MLKISSALFIKGLVSLFPIIFATAQINPIVSGFQGVVTASVFRLGDRQVTIKQTAFGNEGISFLVLHDDENTGLAAATEYCGENGGRITELVYGGVRNLEFKIATSKFAFDPNSMFTQEGIRINLKRYSPSKLVAAPIKAANALGNEVIKKYGSTQPFIITLHNNTEGRFDITSYLAEGYLAGTADSIYINPDMDPDDLVFVTDQRYFDYLKFREVNVVLQSRMAPNDGSLSVYAQQQGIPYLNVEVQHGHVEENLRLITVVGKMLKEIHFEYDQRSMPLAVNDHLKQYNK